MLLAMKEVLHLSIKRAGRYAKVICRTFFKPFFETRARSIFSGLILAFFAFAIFLAVQNSLSDTNVGFSSSHLLFNFLLVILTPLLCIWLLSLLIEVRTKFSEFRKFTNFSLGVLIIIFLLSVVINVASAFFSENWERIVSVMFVVGYALFWFFNLTLVKVFIVCALVYFLIVYPVQQWASALLTKLDNISEGLRNKNPKDFDES